MKIIENFSMVPEKSLSNSNSHSTKANNNRLTMMNTAACNLFKLKEKITSSHSRENSSASSENGKREMSCAAIPLPIALKPEIVLSDRSLVAVYCFIKNFIG